MPYKRLFSHVIYERDLLDHGQEYVCDLADIPVPDGSFDPRVLLADAKLRHRSGASAEGTPPGPQAGGEAG